MLHSVWHALGSGASPATSRSAIADALPLNGGHGWRTSTCPRTNTAHAAPISDASAASRWVAQAWWLEQRPAGVHSPQRSNLRLNCRILRHLAARREGSRSRAYCGGRAQRDRVA